MGVLSISCGGLVYLPSYLINRVYSSIVALSNETIAIVVNAIVNIVSIIKLVMGFMKLSLVSTPASQYLVP